jgi:hypothetical protein
MVVGGIKKWLVVGMRRVRIITRLIKYNPLLWSEGVRGRTIIKARSENSGIRWGVK